MLGARMFSRGVASSPASHTHTGISPDRRPACYNAGMIRDGFTAIWLSVAAVGTAELMMWVWTLF
jgi:hypothetical protein